MPEGEGDVFLGYFASGQLAYAACCVDDSVVNTDLGINIGCNRVLASSTVTAVAAFGRTALCAACDPKYHRNCKYQCQNSFFHNSSFVGLKMLPFYPNRSTRGLRSYEITLP